MLLCLVSFWHLTFSLHSFIVQSFKESGFIAFKLSILLVLLYSLVISSNLSTFGFNSQMKLGGRKDRVIIVMGDFNSMVGETEVDGIVGAFSFGQRNHKGQLLIDYCKEKKFTIRSTQYQTARKRRFTWKHPSGSSMSLIDYMLVDAKHSKSLCKCRQITRPDCGTDHNMVVGILKIQRIKQMKMPKMLPRYNIQLLNYEQIRNKFQENLKVK